MLKLITSLNHWLNNGEGFCQKYHSWQVRENKAPLKGLVTSAEKFRQVAVNAVQAITNRFRRRRIFESCYSKINYFMAIDLKKTLVI